MKFLFEVYRIIRRSAVHEWCVSRNVGDTPWFKCKRLLWGIVFLVKGLWIGLKGIRSEQLGSRVRYNGRDCFVSNWAGSNTPTLAGDGFYERNCDRSKITNVVNLSEIAHRFTCKFSWYMGSWHAIHVQRRLYRIAEVMR